MFLPVDVSFALSPASYLQGKCTFGPRLPDEDVQRLSQYVLDQAAVKWK